MRVGSDSAWRDRWAFSKPHDIFLPHNFKPSNLLSVGLIGHLSRNDQAGELIAPLEALQRAEHVWLVSINLSHDNHHKLLNSKSGLRRAVQQRINNWLPKIGLNLFVFVLEQHHDRWHLHGVVAHPQDRQEDLRRVLKGIAGKATSQVADRKLVHIQTVDDTRSYRKHFGMSGWAIYIGKRLTQSSAALHQLQPSAARPPSPLMATGALKAMMNDGSDDAVSKVCEATEEQLNDPTWGIM